MDNWKLGHRKRVFQKLNKCNVGSDLIYSYELIEMLLFFVHRRRDTKQIAKNLITKFKTVDRILSAKKEELIDNDGIGEQTALLFRIVHELMIRVHLEEMISSQQILSITSVVDYCKSCMAKLNNEQLRMLCLNKRSYIISDVILENGSIDYISIDMRSIIFKALSSGAYSIILIHNHPSGSVNPSDADLKFTLALKEIAEKLSIKLHDHIIISRDSYFSMKKMRII